MAESVWPRRAAAAVLGAGWGAMLAWGAPGQLSYDSVVQLANGRSGHYDTWHPPVMAWLLGLFDQLVPGTLLFLIFTSGLALAALLWLVWLKPRPGWGAAVVAVLIVLTPQWLLYQSEIWKDVLFANAALAGFAALARAEAHWRARRLWLALAALLLVLAALARQNGIILLPVATVTLGAIAARYGNRRIALSYAAALLLTTGVLAVGADAVLIAHGDGGAGAEEEVRYAQSYDLAGALRRSPALQLPILHRADPALERLLRTRGVADYSGQHLDGLMDDGPLADAVDQAPRGAILAQWRNLVLRHPLLYFRTRWPVFRQVLATPDLAACHPLYVGMAGPPEMMRSLGLRARTGPRDQALARYAGLFLGTPLFSHLFFGALAVALLLFFLRRGDLALAGLMAAALAFALTFLIVSVACDYRYLYFLDLAAMAGAFHAAGGWACSRNCNRTHPAPNRL